MNESPSRPRWLPWALGIFPLALFISAGLALWLHFHQEKKNRAEEQERFARVVSEEMVTDDLKKIVEVIGERNTSSAESGKNLSRTASMIEGLLGPSNTGYAVRKTKGPSEWPLISITLPGKKTDAPPVWVVTSYDCRPGTRGVEANATGLVSTLAAAQALARDKPQQALHFVFLPHANDPDAPVVETAVLLQKMIQESPKPAAVLCVEAMGAGEMLWLSSRETTAAPLDKIQGLGAVYGAEVVCLGDDSDLSSILFEIGLPAVRVATRAVVIRDEKDSELAGVRRLAGSSGRLIELVRRNLK